MPDEMIIRHCAPTLAGMKTGNMFTYHFKDSSELRKTMRRLNALFRGKGIRVLPLRYQKNCALIYLYRPSKLSKDLENDVARTILTECGYCVNSPKCLIRNLISRLNSCADFPLLSEVEGSLSLTYLYGLKELELPSLRMTGGDMKITSNDAMVSFSAPSLEGVESLSLASSGSTSINLANIALGSLEEVNGNLSIKYGSMENLSFPKLRKIAGKLELSTFYFLETLSFGSLEECGELSITSIANVRELDFSKVVQTGAIALSGCTGLVRMNSPKIVTGNLSITNASANAEDMFLTEMTGLDTVRGTLRITAANFTEIEIPASVTSIGNYPMAFCTGLTSVTIPDGVTTLGQAVFRDCSNLETVTIGAGVREMGDYTFGGCPAIKSVTCLSQEVPVVTPDIWQVDESFVADVYSSATLYVPDGTKEDYEASEPWGLFANIEELTGTGINGVVSSDGEVSISVADGSIVVSGASSVDVYSLDGTQVYGGAAGTVSGLPSGVYVVKAGGKTAKVAL